MSNERAQIVLEVLASRLDLPNSTYQKVESRYKDLSDWYLRPQSKCYSFDPHIYPQGSFRLGTVVRPLGESDEYDLDVGCRLRSGIEKQTHTQLELKKLVGDDLDEYRSARQIQDDLEEKRRCWCLHYQDERRFQLDVVPSSPEQILRKSLLLEDVVGSGVQRDVASRITDHLGSITDNTDPNYGVISRDWRVSNSEGYAIWFESRMLLASSVIEESAIVAETTVDKLPASRWRSPLQSVIRVLKRHRDCMFKNNEDSKPISIIITTLAARAYRGEVSIVDALDTVSSDMENYVNGNAPRVPNPVNPKEDFADKWPDPKYAHLALEDNFWLWLEKLKADVRALKLGAPQLLSDLLWSSFGEKIDESELKERLGPLTGITSKRAAVILGEEPPKPWIK